jgi:hypothetical protein
MIREMPASVDKQNVWRRYHCARRLLELRLWFVQLHAGLVVTQRLASPVLAGYSTEQCMQITHTQQWQLKQTLLAW